MGKLSTLKDRIEEMRAIVHEGKTIGERANEESKNLREEFPSAVIINTVLAMRWRWKQVAEPRFKKFKKDYSQVRSLAGCGRIGADAGIEQC